MKCSKEYRQKFDGAARDIVGRMTLAEKIDLMSGNITVIDMLTARRIKGEHYNEYPYVAGGSEKYAVPSLRFCDGPRGVVCGRGKTTCFPVPMMRGASFDTALEEEIGRAIGKEVRAMGGNFFGGVCVNVPYNPGWGRGQEVYGEDSYALGQMGSALVRGVQQENVMACVKHYAFNSIENSRFKVNVDCSRRTEREVYLPHFKDCIDAGAASVMTAYNRYKNVYCGHNDYLNRKVLKEEWEFDGFVISDFLHGVKDTAEAVNGGMDIEMPDTKWFGPKLLQAVENGQVSEGRIDEAAVRIIRTLLAFETAYTESGAHHTEADAGTKEHAALALKAAQEGIVLLQNNNRVLPFSRDKVKRLAVIGKLAAQQNIGDHGSSCVFPAYVVTPLEGLQKNLPDVEIVYCDGVDINEARRAAAGADAVVFVAGYDFNDEGECIESTAMRDFIQNATGEMGEKLRELANGFDVSTLVGGQSSKEGGDRKNGLSLHADEVALIQQVGPENPNSAVVLVGGNTITITEWMDAVAGVMMAFYPGQEGGTAIAQTLFGDVNPSGKLPFVLPCSAKDLPAVQWETENQYYEYYHGYAKLDKEGVEPLLPFGYGLSYTSFALSAADFAADGDAIYARCRVANTGQRAGCEVVQMYVGFANSAVDRPVKALRGFARVSLAAGESREVAIRCPLEKLKYYAPDQAAFVLEDMEYEVYIGTSASSKDLLKGTVTPGHKVYIPIYKKESIET